MEFCLRHAGHLKNFAFAEPCVGENQVVEHCAELFGLEDFFTVEFDGALEEFVAGLEIWVKLRYFRVRSG